MTMTLPTDQRVTIALALFFVTHYCGAYGATVDFTSSPVDTQAVEGQTVFCPCEYTGTSDVPLWKINGTTYKVTRLPYGIIANTTGLVFQAFPYHNNTQFQCYFLCYDALTGEIVEFGSDIGVVTVSTGPNSTFPEVPLETCRPTAVTGITISNGGTLLTYSWAASEAQECQNVTYFVQLATCSHNSSTNPTEVCNTTVGTTYAVIDTRAECQGLSSEQPLLFRVKWDGCTDEEYNCYTAYMYIPSPRDTDHFTALEGTGYRFHNLSNGEIDFELCVTGQPYIFGVCVNLTNPSNLNTLRGGYEFCGLDLCINEVFDEIHGTVHTVMDSRFVNCFNGSVEVVINNFILDVTQNNSIVECPLEDLGSINVPVDLQCIEKGFVGGRKVPNGMVCYNGNFKSSNATFFCDEGYFVNGSNTQMCEANGEWSANKTCTVIPDPACKNTEREDGRSNAIFRCEGILSYTYHEETIRYSDEIDAWDECPDCPEDLALIGVIGVPLVIVLVLAEIFVGFVCYFIYQRHYHASEL